MIAATSSEAGSPCFSPRKKGMLGAKKNSPPFMLTNPPKNEDSGLLGFTPGELVRSLRRPQPSELNEGLAATRRPPRRQARHGAYGWPRFLHLALASPLEWFDGRRSPITGMLRCA
jgi:hypothetical protein